MSNPSSSAQPLIPIDIRIEQVDIKGQYIQLAAPIHLSGQLHTSELQSQYGKTTKDAVLPLQIGVDEAGRGPLLGSVNVAAALLPAAWSGLIVGAHRSAAAKGYPAVCTDRLQAVE